MATWQDLANYVRSNYKISDEAPNMIKLVFDTGNLRSQVVLLWRLELEGGAEQWLQIESPFANRHAVDVNRVLDEMTSMVCGGLGIYGDVLTLRHAVPLENMNINELERPLHLVTQTADRLEQMFVGGDQF